MSNTPSVLIVEADIVLRHPLAEYLRECGFKVFEAATGEEAKTALTSKDIRIDIILADMDTPGSGFTLREWVRKQCLDVEIILAGSVERAVEKAGSICVDGPALAKPYGHHLVLDEIKRALARRSSGA